MNQHQQNQLKNDLVIINNKTKILNNHYLVSGDIRFLISALQRTINILVEDKLQQLESEASNG